MWGYGSESKGICEDELTMGSGGHVRVKGREAKACLRKGSQSV